MSRQFDNRQSFLDNEGNPLIGRISFYKFGTTEYEDIETADGTPLPNPIFTNTIGQSVNQVFLKDNKDYTVYFERYIGQGVFTDDPLIDNWEFQYSCVNLYDTFGISLNGNSVVAVDTIEDLKDFNPNMLGDRNFIQVLGYNEIGDCEPVFYKWDSSSVENTNGGSIIGSDIIPGQGRWKLVDTFNETFDVRHFGVFGAMTRTLASDSMGAQIGAAQNYANSIGVKLYFPAIDNDVTWYNIKGVQAIGNGKFAENVWLFDDDNGTHYITCSSDSYVNLYGASDYILQGELVKTSWAKDATKVTYNPTTTLYFDSTVSTNNKTLTGKIVQASALITGWTFDNCVLQVVGKIYDNCKLKNCRVIEQYFADGVDVDSIEVFNTDTIDIDDFQDTAFWVSLRSQVQSTTWDFKGRALGSDVEINNIGTVDISNAYFNSGFVLKAVDITLRNCNGSVSTISPLSNVTLIDSNVAFSHYASQITGALSLNRSSISFGKNMTINTMVVKDSTINDLAYTYYLTASNVTNSALNVAISTDTSGCVMQDTVLAKDIQTGISGFAFTRCTFNGQHIINVYLVDSVISGIWNTCIGNVNNPITFNIISGNLATNESSHNYYYENNIGTFKPKKAVSLIYKNGANIDQTTSGSFETPTYGHVLFYIKDRKIIMMYPYIESKNLDLFHIGSVVNYKMTMEFIINYSVTSTLTIPISFTEIKEYTGNVPNDNWINGYVYTPLFDRLGTYDPTVLDFKCYLTVEKV